MTNSSNQQTIDLSVTGQQLDRYFLAGIGSCHAYLTLREDWRDHARLVQREIGFKSERAHGIFHVFRFLSHLYEAQRAAGDSCHLTRSAQGDLRLLSWNFNEPQAVDFAGGDYSFGHVEKEERFRLKGLHGHCRIRGWRVDRAAGNAYRARQVMGSPQYLSAEAVQQLKRQAEPVLFQDPVENCPGTLILAHYLPPNGPVYYDIERLQ